MKISVLYVSMILLITPFFAKAQTTLDAIHLNPVDGDTYDYQVFGQGATMGPSGTHQTWDFSDLTIITSRTGSYTTSNLYGANMLYYRFGSYTYSVVDATGIEVQYSSDEQVDYSNGDGEMVLMYPLSYGASYTDSYEGALTDGSGGTKVGTNQITVDGYGTLILPGGQEVNHVLRVHITKNRSDVNTNGIHYNDTIEEYYSWFKMGYHTEVLTMALYTSGYSGLFVDDPTLTIFEKEQSNSLQILGNPFTNSLSLEISSEDPDELSILVYDATGRLIHFENNLALNTGSNRFLLNTHSWEQGIYQVYTQTSKGVSTMSVVKEN